MMIPVACVVALAAGESDAGAWLDKAVKAHGGSAALSTTLAYVCRAKVTSHFGRRELIGNGTLYREGEKRRDEATYDMGESSRDVISTWDGEEAWREGRGRRSEQPVEPARVEAKQQPLVVLRRASEQPGKLTVLDEAPNAIRLALVDELGKVEIELDPATALIRSLAYDYPSQDGLDEIKIKKRVDRFERWTEAAGRPPLPWLWRSEIDGIERIKVEVESVEVANDLDDSLFRLAVDDEPLLPGDELAD